MSLGFILPGRKILALIAILSLIGAVHYAADLYFPPQGKVFVGYSDDALMLTIMNSWSTNFADPWSFDSGRIWHNPLIGAFYLFLVLGFVPSILQINQYLAFVIFKIAFAFLYYMVIYNLILLFLKERKSADLAFTVFALVAGIGGIIYIASYTLFRSSEFLPVIGYAFTREFDELAAVAHSLTHIFRLYYVIPETLGYLSLFFFIKKKEFISALCLGLAFLFYPMHGIAFSIVIGLYFIFENRENIFRKKILGGAAKTAALIISSAVFGAIFWILPSLQRPYYFSVSRLVFEGLPSINLFVSFFFALAFIAYLLYKKPAGILRNRVFAAAGMLLLLLFSLENLYPLTQTSLEFGSFAKITGLYGVMETLHLSSFVIDYTILAFGLIAIFSLIKSKYDYKMSFLISWVILLGVLSGFNPSSLLNAANPVRFAPSLIFPVSLLGYMGMTEFSKNFKTSVALVVAALVVLSLPSLAGYNLWLQKSARETQYGAFFSFDENNAFTFLKSQDQGRVMSDLYFGAYIPYYTEKEAVAFSGRNYTGMLLDINTDVTAFFSKSTGVKKRSAILDKYNVTYILLSGRDSVDENAIPINFRKILDNETKVFKRA